MLELKSMILRVPASELATLNPDQISFLKQYRPVQRLRFVTATALFDGHDASINIIRRLLQQRGAELIHLGHNRTAQEVADAAIQEDVQGLAVSSYQGGHMEFFRYVRELVNSQGGEAIRIFGGGGGVITLAEIAELSQSVGATIYSPEAGQRLGLDGMIGHMLLLADFSYETAAGLQQPACSRLARALTLLENNKASLASLLAAALPPTNVAAQPKKAPVLGVTGTGGAGKSSLLDELLLRFLDDFAEIRIGVICVDPSKKKTGGALLGDRIRINASADPRIFLRSLASRGSGRELANVTREALTLMQSQGFDFIVVETSGIGQGDTGIVDLADVSLYVMTPEFGAATQLEKIDMLDYADLIAVNKFERRQGPDALREIQHTLRRGRFQGLPPADDAYPVYGTIASRFNDDGTNGLYKALVGLLAAQGLHCPQPLSSQRSYQRLSSQREALIPSQREQYLAEIAACVRNYHSQACGQTALVKKAEALEEAERAFAPTSAEARSLKEKAAQAWQEVEPGLRASLEAWPRVKHSYESGQYRYVVRGKEVKVASQFKSLASAALPRIALPAYQSKADLAQFLLQENLPGSFPYTGGLFPFRRRGEDPKRQFAGEGGPARTNKRFHYLCAHEPAKRLSTAFDSVTLYGANPDRRPDIYGKIGESGVSIAHLDDMKQLFAGFDLCNPLTSVSMTINGPAPIILALYLNAAIDQQIDKFTVTHQRPPTASEHAQLYDETLQQVRGTVQADILKEDQAQNTCIFSTEFALRMMGDVQAYFIEKSIRNYYAVSISGYHIAEAGANPITQLAFTLANGFTYVEYYLQRGFAIDDFAPNLSFFFSNGIEAEYAVLGRVARRIWAIALRDRYGANPRGQMLKYHIQTSGRSLHAQEMDFNDIRTTLQGLLALYDNCNSLHTNAYDEAVTTPTEESVRRALAIQLIINEEFGPNKCENVNQGSFFIRELTDLVEEAVLQEFERLSARGGVLGAMETQYQRSKIQEESMLYEHLKHSGELPLIGVNTFLKTADLANAGVRAHTELIRASYEEKDAQLQRLKNFQEKNQATKERALKQLKQAAWENKNIFAQLMHTVRHCSLGEISEVLYAVGGRYRRCM